MLVKWDGGGAAILELTPTTPEIQMDVTTEKLMQDLKTVVGDAEEVLKATAAQSGEQIGRIRARAEDSLRTARARMKDVTQVAEAQAREVAGEVDRRVREQPWTAIGVAAGLGLLMGMILGRK